MEDCRIRVQNEMLNEMCRDHSHLQNKFSSIQGQPVGILIEADALTASVPRQFTIGPIGTA